jgi:hypothetical protein
MARSPVSEGTNLSIWGQMVGLQVQVVVVFGQWDGAKWRQQQIYQI